MKMIKKFVLLIALLLPLQVEAQYVRQMNIGASPGGCSFGYLYTQIFSGDLWYCSNGVPKQITPIGGSPSFTNLTLSSMTLGSVLFSGAGGLLSQDNANLFWDNTAKHLGIGDATPTYSTLALGTDFDGGFDKGISINAADVTTNGFSGYQVGQSATAAAFFYWAYNATPASATAYLETSSYSNPLNINASVLNLNNASGGNVGVGTIAPLKTLDVNGSGRFTGTASSTITGTADPAASTTLPGTSTLFLTELVVGDRITVNAETRTVTAIASDVSLTVNMAFTDTAGGAAITRLPAVLLGRISDGTLKFVVNDLGNVGIGTTTPITKLQVGDNSASNQYLSFQTDNVSERGILFYLADGTTIRGFVKLDANEDLALKGDQIIFDAQAKASAVVIAESGSVGINDVTPTEGILTVGGDINAALYETLTNCADNAGAAACGAAAAGAVVIDAAATSVVVSTTAVTANSRIFVQEDSSLGTELGVTSNTTTGRIYTITARTAGVSFTVTASAAPITNPATLSFWMVN